MHNQEDNFFSKIHTHQPPSELLDESQLLLIKAAIFPKDKSLEAWTRFIDDKSTALDPSSERLLPLIYYNLAIKHELQHFIKRDALKKTHINTYANNYFLFNSFKSTLEQLVAYKIPVLAIKGFAYLPLYYNNIGARKMMDIDIMVPPQHFYQAGLILEEMGWRTFPCQSLKTFNPEQNHALCYLNDAGQSIDLHYHLLLINLTERADEEFWEGAIPYTFNEHHIQTLCPTDHFLHCCFHGNLAGPQITPLRWIVDAYHILEHASIDWDRFVSLSEKKSISLYMIDSLQCLREHFSMKIPLETLTRLHQIPISKADRYMYYNVKHIHKHLLSSIAYHYCCIVRMHKDKSFLTKISLLLKTISSTQKLRYVPIKLPLKIVKKLGMFTFGFVRQKPKINRPYINS